MQSTTKYKVVYEDRGKTRHKGFDDLGAAKACAVEYDRGMNVYGIYNFDDRKIEPIDLPDAELRRSLLRDYISENFPEQSVAEQRKKDQRAATKKVIIAYVKNFTLIGLTIIISGVCNKYFGWGIKPQIGGILAAFFYSGGTLSYLIDWHVKTFGGKGFAERLNESLLILSYVLGTAFTVLSFDMS